MATPKITHEINLEAGYTRWAAQYDQESNALIVLEENLVLPLLSTLSKQTVLDLGAGTGRYALRLAQEGAQVLALDQSEAMLTIARQTAEQVQLEVDFRQHNLNQAIPSQANAFDLVISALVLCHIKDLSHIAQEAYRVLRPGGHFLITDFHPLVIQAGWRTQFSSKGEIYLLPTENHSVDDYLTALRQAGFEVKIVQDGLVREVPAGAFAPDLVEKDGNKPFCLVILAAKPA